MSRKVLLSTNMLNKNNSWQMFKTIQIQLENKINNKPTTNKNTRI